MTFSSSRSARLLAVLALFASGAAPAAGAGGAPTVKAAPDVKAAPAAVPPPDEHLHSVIGSLEATLDGETRTWYVHDGGEVSGAAWTEEGPGRYNAVLTGFGSRDTRSQGSQLTVSFDFAHGDTTARHPLSGRPDDGGAVRLIPSVEDLTTVHTMNDGQVTVQQIAASESQGYRFAGTFAGTLTDADGRAVGKLTNGTFQVEQTTPVAPR